MIIPNDSYNADRHYSFVPLNVSPSVFFDEGGMKVLARAKNLAPNPDFEGGTSTTAPTLWDTAPDAHITGKVVSDSISGEVSIQVSATDGTCGATDRFGIYTPTTLAATANVGLSCEARVDVIGASAAPASLTVDFQLLDSVNFTAYRTTQIKETDLVNGSSGWKRLHLQQASAPGHVIYLNFGIENLPANYTPTAGDYIQITIRRPQYETSDLQGINLVSNPGLRRIDSGVIENASGLYREPGHAVFGNAAANDLFTLDTSKDWGFFIEYQPLTNYDELVNVIQYLLCLESHWHLDVPPYNAIAETHLYIDKTSGGLKTVFHHLAAAADTPANANNPPAQTLSTLSGATNEFQHVPARTTVRFAYWTDWSAGKHYLKYKIGSAAAVLLTGSIGSQPPVNMGTLYRVNIGSDHIETSYWQISTANAIFKYVGIEQGLLGSGGDTKIADAFLAGRLRPWNDQSLFLFNGSYGIPAAMVRKP